MKNVIILSTGTEFISGVKMDTNAAFLSAELEEIGLRVIGKCVVEDQTDTIKKIFKMGLDLADVVICSGGLGATRDDLTKTAVCEVLQCPLEIRSREVKRLERYFSESKDRIPGGVLQQAMFPRKAQILQNSLGTASGMYLFQHDKLIILLPGPPQELQSMFRQEVLPRLVRDLSLQTRKIQKMIIKTFGIGETGLEERLLPLINQYPRANLALIAEDGEVHLHVAASGENNEHSRQILGQISQAIMDVAGEYVFGYNDDTLPGVLGDLLISQKKMLVAAESCTGGLLSQYLTSVPGASEYFWGSVISYSNKAKMSLLGVQADTLSTFGAISAETAKEMASGALIISGADFSVAITGNAGPTTLEVKKPVGLVYIALAAGRKTIVAEMHFTGTRRTIRNKAAKKAMLLVKNYMQLKT